MLLEYEKYTLWELPEKLSADDEPTKVLPEDSPENERLNAIVATCTTIEQLLIPVSESSSPVARLKNFLFDRTLGYFDYVLPLVSIDENGVRA